MKYKKPTKKQIEATLKYLEYLVKKDDEFVWEDKQDYINI
jgi:hypothetical protein|tara:strand:- start:255 stop:374 length:120 start_codon:yes stop_codon:yes gene_type:complete